MAEYHFRFYQMVHRGYMSLDVQDVEMLAQSLRAMELMANTRNKQRFGVVHCSASHVELMLYGNFAQEFHRHVITYDAGKNEIQQPITGFEKYVFVFLPRDGILLVQYRKPTGLKWDDVIDHLQQLLKFAIVQRLGSGPSAYVRGEVGADRAEVLRIFASSQILEIRADELDGRLLDELPGDFPFFNPRDDLLEPWRTGMSIAVRDLESASARAKRGANLAKNPLAKTLVHLARRPRLRYEEGGSVVEVATGASDTLDVEVHPEGGDEEQSPDLEDIVLAVLRRYRESEGSIRWE